MSNNEDNNIDEASVSTSEEDSFALDSDKEATPASEDAPTIDPVELEKQLLEQARQTLANSRPEDVAAHFCKIYFPHYQRLLAGLSNKDARRVAEHVVQWPWENADPKFNAKEAKEAFAVGTRLIDGYNIMKNAAQLKQAITNEENRIEAEASENNKTVENTEGVENGKLE